MFTFLHAADIHLDSPLRGLDRYEGAPVDEIRLASRQALSNLVDAAISQPVDFVIIAGDVYDGDWQDFQTGLFFVGQLNRLRKAGIPLVLISGNHDAANKMTKSLPLPDNVRALSVRSPETVTGVELGCGLQRLNVAIHGQGFRSAAIDQNVVLGYPAAVRGAFNIGVLHTSLDMETGGPHARYAPCTLADLLAKDYDYWALGHVHQRRIVHESPLVVYPGNLQGRHIREAGEKGAVLVTVDDHLRAGCEFLPLDVFRWHAVTVAAEGAEQAVEVVERATEALRRLAADRDGVPLGVRVTVTGACRAHLELAASPGLWQNQIRAAALNAASTELWIEKVRFHTSPESADVPVDEGPRREVIDYVADLRQDENLLQRLADELAALDRKLPDELKAETVGDPLRPSDPQWLRQMLDQVEPLLLARLSSRETRA
jgi:DNA repair protein SbcD/Mre11